MLQWTRDNTLKGVLPSVPGIYKFYDKNRRLLYVGHAKNLRHRVQSYREVDDPRVHPTKTDLRPRIQYYDFIPMTINKARHSEKIVKRYSPYNYL
jgi:excinuclease UvrABC nuclease subunit